MKAKIAVLPGDGIGPEVIDATLAVLDAVATKYNHEFDRQSYLMGGCAIDATGEALPEETLGACLGADAILLGAVGGPKWDDPQAKVRPEQGLLGLRKALGLYANLRPVVPHPDMLDASPLRPERLAGTDMLVIRELTGGVYFGTPRERRQRDGDEEALDTMIYSKREVSRIAHLAFQSAANRRGKVTSVDKANVLESSRLWRQTVMEVAAEYPNIELEHVLVDAATMHLISRPASFDVIVAGNLFGDILTDEASMLTGSMGNLPSASIGAGKNELDLARGLYEPIHGSAPDIAGKGIANPIGTILSMAMMLRFSLGLEAEAANVEKAVSETLTAGHRTGDLAWGDVDTLKTAEMTKEIVGRI